MSLASDRRPNLVWIIADQLRAQSLGYRGDPNVRTPNIDNLARRGMRFDNAVAGAPWCAPFRGALLSGTYPHQNGVTRTPAPLNPSLPTFAEPFRQAGYHTAWVGKWHVDGSNSVTHVVPAERTGGFDYWLGYENNNAQEESYVNGGYTAGAGKSFMEQRRLDGYETDALTDAFLAHIGEHLGRARPGGDAAEGGGVGEGGDRKPAQSAERQPFFAVLSVQPPHSPYVGPGVRTPVLARPGAPEAPEAGPEKAGLRDAGPVWAPKAPAEISLRPNVPHVARIREQARLDIAGYASMVENLDRNLGRLLTGLRRLDADRETWICFFSDHGDMLGSHGQWEKSSPWEESIRIPFIVARVGGHQKMRTGVSSAVLNHVDIGPTSLGLCGIEKPAWAVGFDYSSHCLRGGEARPARGVGAEADGEPSSAYLQQIPRKFHRHSVNRAWRGVVTRDGWKYVCTPRNDWLLFNLNEDPYEQANLCYDTVYQAEKEACHRELAGWLEETGDDFELPDIKLE